MGERKEARTGKRKGREIVREENFFQDIGSRSCIHDVVAVNIISLVSHDFSLSSRPPSVLIIHFCQV